jgi:hypothetical protein
MTRTPQAGYGQAARRTGKASGFGARVRAFRIVRSTKAATGRNKAGAAFCVFGTMIQKVETGFRKKIVAKQKGGRPNRVPPMRQDRLGEG